ncbi:hypothetical protein I5168_11890 [Nonlabens sp. SCSIO 43208]|uniref:hypothetical protein n=1 Tax=Nonlabens sp. SCSIO 43208 TaxID=2793009 RepID=UPI003D6C32FF
MATIKIATLRNHVRVDQDFIDDATAAGDVLQVEVINGYLGEAPVLVDYDSLSGMYQKAIKDSIDVATYQNEDPAKVFKVSFDGTTHTLDGYVRTGIPSSGTALTSSDELIVVFTIAWFNGLNNQLELPLTIAAGQALQSTETDVLATYGITVSGNSDSFSVSTTTPYKLNAAAPLAASDYVIVRDYDINTIYQ